MVALVSRHRQVLVNYLPIPVALDGLLPWVPGWHQQIHQQIPTLSLGLPVRKLYHHLVHSMSSKSPVSNPDSLSKIPEVYCQLLLLRTLSQTYHQTTAPMVLSRRSNHRPSSNNINNTDYQICRWEQVTMHGQTLALVQPL